MKYLGTITTDAVTPKSQATTAVAFTLPKGCLLLLQPDADTYVGLGDITLSATNGLRLAANSVTEVHVPEGAVQALGVSGAANVKVFVSRRRATTTG